MTSRIPLVDLGAQLDSLGSGITDAISRVVASRAFISGREVARFEGAYAEFCGLPHVAACGCGTSAVYLALRAAGIGPGDEVVVPVNTFIATAEAVSLLGAKPVFADCDSSTGLMTAETAARALTSRTRAVLPVHLYGQLCEMAALVGLTQGREIRLVEDAAQAHGASRLGERAGQRSQAVAYSFFPGKNLGALGDAGAVACRDPELAESVRRLRNHGREDKYFHREIGFNFRMDEIQAAVLSVKLPRLQAWNEARRKLARRYREELRNLDGIRFLEDADPAGSAYHLFVIRAARRDELLSFLKEAGIEAGVHYPVPLHLQPAYRGLGHREGDFPAAESLAREILSLPLYPEMSESDQDRVCESLKAWLRR